MSQNHQTLLFFFLITWSGFHVLKIYCIKKKNQYEVKKIQSLWNNIKKDSSHVSWGICSWRWSFMCCAVKVSLLKSWTDPGSNFFQRVNLKDHILVPVHTLNSTAGFSVTSHAVWQLWLSVSCFESLLRCSQTSVFFVRNVNAWSNPEFLALDFASYRQTYKLFFLFVCMCGSSVDFLWGKKKKISTK